MIKDKDYKIKGIVKIIKASDRDLLEFLSLQCFYQIAKSTGSWKIASENILKTESEGE